MAGRPEDHAHPVDSGRADGRGAGPPDRTGRPRRPEPAGGGRPRRRHPANIYHLFGSRQGLLRAALTRELAQMRAALAAAGSLPFVARRVRMFDVIGSRPRLALTALLALDDDPDYMPLPFIEATRAQYRKRSRGQLPPASTSTPPTCSASRRRSGRHLRRLRRTLSSTFRPTSSAPDCAPCSNRCSTRSSAVRATKTEGVRAHSGP